MKNEIYSPIFGIVRKATLEENNIIKRLVDECPMAVVQKLNELLEVGDLYINIKSNKSH